MSDDIALAVEKLNALTAKLSDIAEKTPVTDGSLFTATIWGALAAVAAAIIAAVIARELKISEFRQAWINGLRDELSEYVSKAYEWMDLYINFNGEPCQQKKAELLPHLEKVKYESFHLLWRVEMRFKPDDEKANALIAKLFDLLDPKAFGVSVTDSASRWRKLADDAIAQSRELLKEEWEVTKNPWRKLRVLRIFRRRAVTLPQQGGAKDSSPREPVVAKEPLLYRYFAGTGLAASLLFFCAAALSAPFQKLVLFMNDPKTLHTPTEWVVFAATCIFFAACWSAMWLWFKGCEKRFLEVYFKMKPQPGASADAPIVAPLS
jgi:hypothetical protein